MTPYTDLVATATELPSFNEQGGGFEAAARTGGQRRFLSARELRLPVAAAFKAAQGESLTPEIKAALTDFFRRIGRRLSWETPLILGLEGSEDLLAALEAALDALLAGVEDGTVSELPRLVYELEIPLAQFGAALGSVRPLTNIPLVNEVLQLGRTRPPTDAQCAGLSARLPLLYAWVRRCEGQWADFATLYPKRIGLIERANDAVQLLKNGVGALALYLEGRQSGPQPDDDLSKAGRMLVGALEMLGPLLETRRNLEAERATFSEDLRVDRASKSWQQSGKISTTQIEELAEFLDEMAAALASAGGRLLAEPAKAEEVDAEGVDIQRRLASLRESLKGVRLQQSQEASHSLLEEFEAVRRSLAQHFEQAFVGPDDTESHFEMQMQQLFCSELAGVLFPEEWNGGVAALQEEAEGIVEAAGLRSPELGKALEPGADRLRTSLEQAILERGGPRVAQRKRLSEAYWGAVSGLEAIQVTLEEFSQAALMPPPSNETKPGE